MSAPDIIHIIFCIDFQISIITAENSASVYLIISKLLAFALDSALVAAFQIFSELC